jgi:hypothetical protein
MKDMNARLEKVRADATEWADKGERGRGATRH